MIGKPLDRIDGPLKVTGRATYSYEYKHAGEMAYGFISGQQIPVAAQSSVAKTLQSMRRRIARIDIAQSCVTNGNPAVGAMRRIFTFPARSSAG